MNPRIRLRRPPSIGSNQASPANSPCSAAALLLSLSMAWSPPALERRSWLVTQAGDYAPQISHHPPDGTPSPPPTRRRRPLVSCIERLKPFPEVPAALDRLRARYRLVVLSNGDPDMLEAAKPHHGV